MREVGPKLAGEIESVLQSEFMDDGRRL